MAPSDLSHLLAESRSALAINDTDTLASLYEPLAGLQPPPDLGAEDLLILARGLMAAKSVAAAHRMLVAATACATTQTLSPSIHELRAECAYLLGAYEQEADAHFASALASREARQLSAAWFRQQHLADFDGPRQMLSARRATVRMRRSGKPGPVSGGPEKRLRVGWLGIGLDGLVSRYQVRPAILATNRDQFEPVLLPVGITEPENLDAFYPGIDRVPLDGLSAEQAAERIRAADIDIIMDFGVGLLGEFSWLAAQRAAPIHIGFSFASSGMEELLLMLDDDISPPEGSAGLYAEKRLLTHPICFAPFVQTSFPKQATSAPVLRNGHITFASFASLNKLTPETLELWRIAMAAVPDSVMIVKTQRLQRADVLEHFCVRVNRAGLDLRRFRMLSHVSEQEHSDLFGEVDIMLDSTPYCGVQTTGEALAHGVPVISVVGQMAYARMGKYLLGQAGLCGLAVNDPAAVGRVAAELASDPTALDRLRTATRERFATAPIADVAGWMRATERLFRDEWRRLCR